MRLELSLDPPTSVAGARWGRVWGGVSAVSGDRGKQVTRLTHRDRVSQREVKITRGPAWIRSVLAGNPRGGQSHRRNSHGYDRGHNL